MDYPGGFEVPSFPAGKRIMFTRVAGIAAMVVFLLILVMCGLIVWAQRSARVHPFLVSVNQITGQWEIVGHQHEEVQELSSTRALQESVIGNFVRNWFLVTENADLNNRMWESCDRVTQCNPEKKTGIDTNQCAVYCIVNDDLYAKFTKDIVPEYRQRMQRGETLVCDMSSLNINPIGAIGDAGGMWLVQMVLRSDQDTRINIIGYAKIARNMDAYPKTLGYYVADFNAYNVGQ